MIQLSALISMKSTRTRHAEGMPSLGIVFALPAVLIMSKMMTIAKRTVMQTREWHAKGGRGALSGALEGRGVVLCVCQMAG